MADDLTYKYHTIKVSGDVMRLMRTGTEWDPRPVYGPPRPMRPHSCDCIYCDQEGEDECW